MRNVLAVIVGLTIGMVVNMALIKLNAVFYPLPEGMDDMDLELMNAHIATLPTLAFILPMLAHLGQAFLGGWFAARMGKSRPILLAMIVGVLSLVGGLVMFYLLPDAPKWTMIELPLYLVFAWIAGRMVASCRAAATS